MTDCFYSFTFFFIQKLITLLRKLAFMFTETNLFEQVEHSRAVLDDYCIDFYYQYVNLISRVKYKRSVLFFFLMVL